jgi:hypothetical protein
MKNLAESSKEGSGSKRAVLPMMMMIIIIIIINSDNRPIVPNRKKNI